MRWPSRGETHRNRTILGSHLRHISNCRVLYGVLISVIWLKTQGDMPLSSLRYRGIFNTYHMGQFSTSTHGEKIVSFVYLKNFLLFIDTEDKNGFLSCFCLRCLLVGAFSMEHRIVPSSRIVLSPKTTTSNSRFAIRRFKIFLLGLLLALMSSAHIPITPNGAGLAKIELLDVAHIPSHTT